MMSLRLVAVIACIIAIIFFILSAAASTASGDASKDLAYGLVALAAALGLIALEGVIPNRPVQ